MKDTLAVRVRFGAFELDLHTGELHGGEETVQLGEKPFRVLLILTEREGELATREEIQKKLWPNDTVVDFEHGINAAIKSLRRALSDSADNPKYIETLARHGYRLIVPVEWVNSGKDGEGQELRPAVLTGRTVSHYRALDIIGGGGMGVVYRAEDLKLGRQVALKFLPEELGSDPHALERFSREARAASSLDHPNICSIHEFGEHEGRPFIVMPLLRGQTLRDRMAADERTLPLAELLDIGIQVSAGLQAAHERGIIHRDIKPANILLTTKGVVKILDFGLAKLMEAGQEEQSVTDAAGAEPDDALRVIPSTAASKAADATLTRTGLAMGTAGYMSPEQVRGDKLDPRTDIFSIGLVLYEMATGQRAFSGETAAVVHNAILHSDPAPARQLNAELPPVLDGVIRKTLEKDREKRYQTAAELLAELQTIKAEMETPHAWHPGRRRAMWLGIAVVALIIAFLVARMMRQRPNPQPVEAHEQQLTANPPEIPVGGAAISPDGKYVAYHDQAGLYLRAVDSGEISPIALPAELRHRRLYELCWLPMGGKLVAEVLGYNGWDLWLIPVLAGGQPRLLYRHAGEPAVSPDGQKIAFVGYEFGTAEQEVWVGSMDGGAPRKLVAAGEFQKVYSPTWSPDGRWIAYGRSWKTSSGTRALAIEARASDGGSPQTLVAESSLPKPVVISIGNPLIMSENWLADWRLVFSVAEGIGSAQGKYSLWQVSLERASSTPVAPPERLTQWNDAYPFNLSATADGTRLAAVMVKGWFDVYLAALNRGGGNMETPRRFTLDQRGSNLNQWTPDGKSILFASERNGKSEIFRQGVNDRIPERLLDAAATDISPDGKWLIYVQSQSGPDTPTGPPDSALLMRRLLSGGPSQKILELNSEQLQDLYCSSNPKASVPCALGLHEGKDLAFYSLDPLQGKGKRLGEIEVGGRYIGWKISADASHLALVDQDRYGPCIEVMTIADGHWRELCVDPAVGHFQSISWTADGKGFFASSITPDGYSVLHVTAGGKANLLFHTPGRRQFIRGLLASPDGKYLAFGAHTWDGNVWVIETR